MNEKENFIKSLIDAGWAEKEAETAYEEYKSQKTQFLDLGLSCSGIHPETYTYRNTSRGGCSG